MSRREKRKANNKKLFRNLIFVLILIFSVSFISIFARYATKTIKNNYFESREFYFNSDKLTEEIANYQLENWSGVDDYTITINMNSQENNLKSTQYDIDYEIALESSENVICTLSKTSGTIYEATHSDFFTIMITPNTLLNDGDKVLIKVTATSAKPYIKTLTAEFTLIVGKEKLSYEIQDEVNSQYLEINLTNTLTYYIVDEAFDTYSINDRITSDIYMQLQDIDKQKCHSAEVTLTFNPKDVTLDMTNYNYLNAINEKTEIINGSTYINEVTFKIDAVSSSKVRFYKNDITKNYSYPYENTTSIIEVTSR